MINKVKVQTSPSPIPIIRNELYVLGGTVEHEGFISWVPADADGSEPLNAYVYVDGDHGLVIDTSLPVMGETIITQLKTLGLKKLTIVMTRPPEFDSIGNAETLVRNFEVDRVYSELMFPADEWVQFRSDEDLPKFEPGVYRKNTDVDFVDGRTFNVIDARLKLLACAWLFDEKTGTLFTSDAFTHVLSREPGEQTVTEAFDVTRQEDVTRHLGTKYEWLKGSYTEPLRKFLQDVFSTYDVQTIAPITGCAIIGRELVARHVAMMDEALQQLAEQESKA